MTFSDAVREDGGVEAEIAALIVRSDDSRLPAVTERCLLYTPHEAQRNVAGASFGRLLLLVAGLLVLLAVAALAFLLSRRKREGRADVEPAATVID